MDIVVVTDGDGPSIRVLLRARHSITPHNYEKYEILDDRNVTESHCVFIMEEAHARCRNQVFCL